MSILGGIPVDLSAKDKPVKVSKKNRKKIMVIGDHTACGILALDLWKSLDRSFVASNAAARQPKHSAAMLNLCLLCETE